MLCKGNAAQGALRFSADLLPQLCSVKIGKYIRGFLIFPRLRFGEKLSARSLNSFAVLQKNKGAVKKRLCHSEPARTLAWESHKKR